IDRRRPGAGGLANANPNSAALFVANNLGAEATSAGGPQKRLRLPTGRSSLEQHWTAAERFGAGAESRWVRRGGIEGARARSSTRESHGAPLGARRGKRDARRVRGHGREDDAENGALCTRL